HRQLPASAGQRTVCACVRARCPVQPCAGPRLRPCRPPAAEASRPPGAPSRGRWRSPALATALRACPLARGGSPPAQTHLLPSWAPCPPPCPRAPSPALLCLPFRAYRLRAKQGVNRSAFEHAERLRRATLRAMPARRTTSTTFSTSL